MTNHHNLGFNLRVVVAVGVLGCLASFTFLGALHSPEPHEMELALVGDPQTTGPIAVQLEEQAPGSFDIHPVDTRDEAVRAIRERDVAAAFVPGTTGSELLLAGANGAMQASTLTTTFDHLAEGTGSDLTVEDVRPAPSDDRAGLSPFLLVVSLTIPALALALLITMLGGKAGLGPRPRLAAALAGAVGVALVNTAVADFALDALTGHFWEVAGVSALTVFALSSATLALQRLLGAVGLPLAVALFLVIGMPATGAAIGPSYLPGVLRAVTLALPSGEAVPALRGVQYFGGAATATPLWLLAAWAIAATLLMVIRLPARVPPAAAPAHA